MERGCRDKLIFPDTKTQYQKQKAKLIATIKECSKRRDLKAGLEVHGEVVAKRLHKSKYLSSLLITMYSKCHCMQLAQQVFDEVAHPDVVLWNSLILGYVANGESSAALKLFTRMQCEPSSVTYVALLKACGSLAKERPSEKLVYVDKGTSIREEIEQRGLFTDIFVATTIIDMYCKCGDMQLAREVFEKLTNRNVVAWNSLILGYVDNGQSTVAMDVFAKMDCEPSYVTYVAILKACGALASAEHTRKQFCLEKGIGIHEDVKAHGFDSYLVVATALVDMYSKCGSLADAREVFDTMIYCDVVAWTALMLGYVENDQSLKAMHLFEEMDCEPTSVTYIVMLKACGCLAKERLDKQLYLGKGIEFHEKIKRCRGFDSDILLSNSLIDMYAKCGCMESAKNVFDSISHPDVVSWNSLIMGFVENGNSSLALHLFTKMNCEPNSLTFVAALKACSCIAKDGDSNKQFGLKSGFAIHKHLKELGLDSDVIVSTTLLDMYCKCGAIDCAKKIFDEMPCPNDVTWNSLILGYVEDGESMVAIELFTTMDCDPDAFTYAAALKAASNLSLLSMGKKIHARICKQGLEKDKVIANSLLDLYMKCGCTCKAEEVFTSMHAPSLISWNIMMTGYSMSKDPFEVFHLKSKMQDAGVHLDNVTYVCLLIACSRVGLVEESKFYFKSMSMVYGVVPNIEHYNCLIDVLSRANMLQETMAFVKRLQIEPNHVTCRTLMAICKSM